MASMIAKTKTGIGKTGIGKLNTKVWEDNGHFMVQLYDTVVYDEDRTNGKLTLNTGGWSTHTTARRINQAFAYRGVSNRVGIRKGVMVLYCHSSSEFVSFENGKLVIELQRMEVK